MEDMNGKLGVLKKLRDAASARMKGGLKDMKGMSKVSVLADSKEGLKKGLEVAEDAMEGEEGMEDAMPQPEGEKPSKVDAIIKSLSDEECMELYDKLKDKYEASEEASDEAEEDSEEESSIFDV